MSALQTSIAHALWGSGICFASVTTCRSLRGVNPRAAPTLEDIFIFPSLGPSIQLNHYILPLFHHDSKSLRDMFILYIFLYNL